MSLQRTIITGSGCHIPERIQSNQDFARQTFYSDGQPLKASSEEIVRKFKAITGIEERRYADESLNASDIGALAARAAIENSGINPEEIDQLIVAHNFGNVLSETHQSLNVPSVASRIKHALGIRNPSCIAYDILFGCPGWLQGVIQADAFFKAGIARKALVIGTETLSRVIDLYDRDSMIFSDGAGATVLEFKESGSEGPGMLSSLVATHAIEEVDYIDMGRSELPNCDSATHFIKMKGRKVYEYALSQVPVAMKRCLDESGQPIESLRKIFLHQANEKMDEAIVHRFFALYNHAVPDKILPMSINWLGNSSVATIPTLYDLVQRGELQGHQLQAGDIIMFASVGAGMNINAVTYRC